MLGHAHVPQYEGKDWLCRRRIGLGCMDQRRYSTPDCCQCNQSENRRAQSKLLQIDHSSWDWCILSTGTWFDKNHSSQIPFITLSGISYPQCRTPTGMKKPLVNPAIAETTGDRRNATSSGKPQTRAMRRAIQVWFKATLTTRTWRNTRTS